MFNLPFDAIQKTHIDTLVLDEVAEGRTLEYKLELPGNTDENKREFLADVSSFANATGGDIVYGIEERRDGNKNTGVPASSPGLSDFNADAEILRLEHLIRDGIDPRIPGVQAKCITGFANGPVLLLRIPQSWDAPHMVKFQNYSRFYSRTSNGKYQLDVREIRAAIEMSMSVPERIRTFRNERLRLIESNEGPVVFNTQPDWATLVLHLYPLSALNNPNAIDTVALAQVRNHLDLPRLGAVDGAPDGRFNLDGWVTRDIFNMQNEVQTRQYVQLFRSGIIEAVAIRDNTISGNCLPQYFDRKLRDSITRYLQLMRFVGLELPIVIMLSMLNARGYQLYIHQDMLPHNVRQLGTNQPFDRDKVMFSEIVVNSYDEDVASLIKPLLDTLYQATGWARCLSYDDNGNWTG